MRPWAEPAPDTASLPRFRAPARTLSLLRLRLFRLRLPGLRVVSWLTAVTLALSVLLPVGAGPRAELDPHMPKARVRLGSLWLKVDVADTPALQERGLGGRRRLAAEEGMLFPYAERGLHVFWMKGMLISIDMLWLDNGRIMHIESRVPTPRPGVPDDDLPTYTSGTPANFVLEIAAGRARELGVHVGDQVDFDFSGR
jgi:uncharacterized membrane protein (UPF0127 family)